MNRYVKVKGHPNWFLVMESGDSEPENFGENMKEQILRSRYIYNISKRKNKW